MKGIPVITRRYKCRGVLYFDYYQWSFGTRFAWRPEFRERKKFRNN